MASSNLYTVETNEQFQELLSQDLQRVSLINFWAPWAAPCKQMNEVVEELSKKHPKLLALNVRGRVSSAESCCLTVARLQVEAETLPDVAESFDIEAVPAFIILRVRIFFFAVTLSSTQNALLV
jgi:thiol-disulfide isomerase/thioredoxin